MHHARRIGGFSLVEMLVVLVVIAVVIVVILPRLAGVHRYSGPIHCRSQLKQIAISFQEWAKDHNDKFPDQVSVANGGTMELVGSGVAYFSFLVMSNQLSTPKILVCPDDNKHVAVTNWSSLRNGNVSYFVGLDASVTKPQMLLSGDDNFMVNGAKPRCGLLELRTNATLAWLPTRHVHYGNILLADGSVRQFSSAKLQQALAETGATTNRLLMP